MKKVMPSLLLLHLYHFGWCLTDIDVILAKYVQKSINRTGNCIKIRQGKASGLFRPDFLFIS